MFPKIRSGTGRVFAAALLLAVFPVFIRELSKSMGSYWQIFGRAIILLPIAAFRLRNGAWQVFGRRLADIRIWGVGIGYAWAVTFFTLSLGRLTVGTAVFCLFSVSTAIGFGYDMWSGVLKVNTLAIFSFGLSVAGVALASLGSASVDMTGGMLAVLAGFGEGLANVSRVGLKGRRVDEAMLVQGVCAGTVGLALGVVLSSPSSRPVELTDIAILILFGMLLYVVGHLLASGFSDLYASRGVQVLSLEVPIASLVAYLLYREAVSLLVLGGLVCMLLSLSLRDRIVSTGSLDRRTGDT